MSEAVEALVPAEGWGVLHLFFRLSGDRREAIDLTDVTALVDAFVARGALPGALVRDARRDAPTSASC